jgi:hypothetical protein
VERKSQTAVDADRGTLDTLIPPHANTDCVQIFREEIASRHPNEKLVIVINLRAYPR